ncbi:MAG TPA: hypothetical protein V6C72_20040, partial [Chroococcales cyanobacterium]
EAIDGGGYAIIEQGGATLRVLEVIGSERAQVSIWGELLTRAVKVGAKRIRGWEGLVRNFAPSYLLKPAIPRDLVNLFDSVHSGEREWGIPMILPLRSDLEGLSVEFPCPLLELDHF